MLFFGQLLHRVFIVIDQGHDLTAAMFFFTERLLAQAIFLEEDFTDFRQQETVLADDSRFPGNPDNPQDLAAHDDGIIDALADTLFRAIFLDGLNLSRPGGNMAGLVVGTNTAAVGAGHDTTLTVDEIDVPTDDGLGRIDDLLGQFIGDANFHLTSPHSPSFGKMYFPKCSSPHSHIAFTIGSKVRPYPVRLYSVLGGTTG